jgi:hypothetical protein
MLWWMTVLSNGYLKSHHALKQEAPPSVRRGSSRKHIFSETEEINEDYVEFLILLLFVKTHQDVLTNYKELQENFELLRKEMIKLEKQKYTTAKNFAGNNQTFVETLEDFAEIVRITFRNFDELCSMYNTTESIIEEKESKIANKYNTNINKYRVII